MTISELAFSVLFGPEVPPTRYWIGLAKANRELMDPGYDRQLVLRTQWRMEDGMAVSRVGFGPFFNAVEFDTTLLFAEQQLLESISIVDGPVRLTPGMLFEHAIKVAISGR